MRFAARDPHRRSIESEPKRLRSGRGEPAGFVNFSVSLHCRVGFSHGILPFLRYGGGPEAGLATQGNVLYGTTPDGGTFGSGRSGAGTVFSLNTLGTTFKILHNFGSMFDGASPQAPLVISNGVLYGTTTEGRFHGKGTVFSVRIADNQERVIYSFGGTPDGSAPQGAVLVMNGTLYGTTPGGNPQRRDGICR